MGIVRDLFMARKLASGVSAAASMNLKRRVLASAIKSSREFHMSAVWESGGYNESDGSETTTNTRIRTDAKVHLNAGDKIVIDTTASPKVSVIAYKLDGTFDTLLKAAATSATSVAIESECLVGVAIGKSDDTSIASSAYKTLAAYVTFVHYVSNTISRRDEFEPGQLNTTTQTVVLYNTEGRVLERCVGFYEVTAGDVIQLTIDPDDVTRLTEERFYWYDSDGKYKSYTTVYPREKAALYVPANVKYFKASVKHASGDIGYKPFKITATSKLVPHKHPYGYYTNYRAYPFNYLVTDTDMSFGRLILPSSYSMDGEPVPLVVYFHGSGSFTYPGAAVVSDYSPYFQYLADEGIAWFDCYPWTDSVAYDEDHRPYSPICTDVNIQAYLKGIDYVCSHFNVDKNKVVCYCKSQGGNLGHWACVETVFPFKAVGLMAATVDPVMQKSNGLYYNANTRQAMLDHIDFAGTDAQKTAFVSVGKTTDADTQGFLAANKSLLTSMLPYAQGIFAPEDELFTGGYETIETTPAWMLAEDVPARDNSADLIPKFANRSDYKKTAERPVKFWCSWGDTQVSAYGNYAVYKYLKNGNSDVTFRALEVDPNDTTGGHHSMDTYAAEKSSGTTRLGVAYTDIPKAYVELADFFYDNLD